MLDWEMRHIRLETSDYYNDKSKSVYVHVRSAYLSVRHRFSNACRKVDLDYLIS